MLADFPVSYMVCVVQHNEHYSCVFFCFLLCAFKCAFAQLISFVSGSVLSPPLSYHWLVPLMCAPVLCSLIFFFFMPCYFWVLSNYPCCDHRPWFDQRLSFNIICLFSDLCYKFRLWFGLWFPIINTTQSLHTCIMPSISTNYTTIWEIRNTSVS